MEASHTARGVIDEVLADAGSSFSTLVSKQAKVRSLMAAGLVDEAHTLAQRALASCDRLYQQLQAASLRLQTASAQARARMSACLGAAGGLVLIGVTTEYLGFASGRRICSSASCVV